jgi:hypothetical protein
VTDLRNDAVLIGLYHRKYARSEPQVARAVTFITASRGCSICGSGPVSDRILPLPCLRASSCAAPCWTSPSKVRRGMAFGGVRRDDAITDKSLVATTRMPVAPVVVPRSGSRLLDKASRRAERDPDQKKQHCDKAAHGEALLFMRSRVGNYICRPNYGRGFTMPRFRAICAECVDVTPVFFRPN